MDVQLTHGQMHDQTQHFVHKEGLYMFGSVGKGCRDEVNDVRVVVVWWGHVCCRHRHMCVP